MFSFVPDKIKILFSFFRNKWNKNFLRLPEPAEAGSRQAPLHRPGSPAAPCTAATIILSYIPLMRSITYFLYNIVLPVLSAFLIGFLYRQTICHFANDQNDAGLICDLSWKDGFILLCCYAVIRPLSFILHFNTILQRLIATSVLYVIAYGLLAWPYMLSSFFQPLRRNVFMHGLALLLFIEYIFWKTAFYKRSINKTP